MPLSAHEQRVLADIEDALNRQDPQLTELFTRCPPPTGTRTAQESRRPGARWAAVPIVLAVWALVAVLVVVSGVGLINAVLIVLALVMLVAAHLVRFFARRTLYRPYGMDVGPGCSHRED
jgi:hypothetical protein